MTERTTDRYDIIVEEEGGSIIITNRTEYYERTGWTKYTVTYRHLHGLYVAIKLTARDADHARHRAHSTLLQAARRRPMTIQHPRDYVLQNTQQDRREEPDL
jgi:hypothetical protein